MAENKIIPSSLIQFSVSNFGCFRDKVEFSMATRSGAKNSFTLKETGDSLLKSSIIYGPNASGKSTLLDAMAFMDSKIRKSTDLEHDKKLSFSPFLMEEGREEDPVLFEITFLLGEKIYKYSFSLLADHTVVEEELYNTTSKDILLFSRKKQEIEKINPKFTKDKDLKKKMKEKALFLTVASQWDKKAEEIVSFFLGGINFFKGYDSGYLAGYTAEKSKKEKYFKEKVLKYLQKADFCLTDFNVQEKEAPEELKKMIEITGGKIPEKVKTINFSHPKYNKKGDMVGEIKLHISQESTGTQAFFQYLGPILDTLEFGKVLVIDELNSNLHPDLLKFIVSLFNSKKTNPHNAQIIFTTHDVSLLSEKDIDRDQFWFTERDKYGRATLFSLAEFKERKGSDFQKRYLEGRYGALPFIDTIDSDLL